MKKLTHSFMETFRQYLEDDNANIEYKTAPYECLVWDPVNGARVETVPPHVPDGPRYRMYINPEDASVAHVRLVELNCKHEIHFPRSPNEKD